MSVTELRRRLLSSTPPSLAKRASEPASLPVQEESPTPQPTASWGGNTELLSRLRMPGPPAPVRPPVEDVQGVRPPVNRRTPIPGRNPFDPPSHSGDPAADAHRLRVENKELRTLLDEMKQLLQEASETEAKYVERAKETAAALEEKEHQIEELSSQLQLIEEQISKGELAPPPAVPKTRGELEEWADELEQESFKISQERKHLDTERQQFREDEEGLETQMREMEVSMARERALIARQETELKRLSSEIQHELEIMQRGDASLREHMQKFQRRAQEVLTNRPPGSPGGGGMPGRR